VGFVVVWGNFLQQLPRSGQTYAIICKMSTGGGFKQQMEENMEAIESGDREAVPVAQYHPKFIQASGTDLVEDQLSVLQDPKTMSVIASGASRAVNRRN
jgi:hypothetical protein